MLPVRVLVVDDEPQVRSLLRSLLARQGYEVMEAGDGEEALSLCEQGGCFDVLLTDVVMPRMDGLQLSERVAAIMPRIRVLFMSGRCEIEKVAALVTQFGFGFIKKPFQIEEVSESIRLQLRAGKTPRPSRRRPAK
jgi:two-component system cell cycle sensor histidine kinase/response regulator CckA